MARSVKSIKATDWTCKDIKAITEALPEIRFECKNQKQILINNKEQEDQEEPLNQPLKLQKIIPDIDFEYLAQDGWNVPSLK